jgi:TolB-like protein/class 3 adenylate cyclase/Flp pilus assembly protein TadD
VSETRKLAAILVSDVVGYSRLAGADEEQTLARLRGLRSDLIDPTIAARHGRVVKRTGDGAIVEFRSVVDAVNCAVEVQRAMIERNTGVAPDKRIEFRLGIHLGDVVEESDGDLMGDGVNIAARLEGVAKPGAICLSEDAYRQVRQRLDLKVTDLGLTQLKNIAEPVRVYLLEVGQPVESKPTRSVSVPERHEPPRFSIVVLPFANLGSDPEQDYFVDGITESLTTDLSRISGAFVIGRSTAFTYKGKAADVKQIGRELNVRYVMEGSVHRRGDRMRVNVQLVDAEDGNHLWAERFDKPVADLFDMQDEIVSRLGSQLTVELVRVEALRSERTPNPDSLDLVFQGSSWWYKGRTLENLTRARALVERALALDPSNARALVLLAAADLALARTFYPDDAAARLATAETATIKALSLAPEYSYAHFCLGCVMMLTNRAEQGIAQCERALAINPNLAMAHSVIGFCRALTGRAEETEAHVREALRLSPRDIEAYSWLYSVGAAKCFLGRYEEAIAWLRRSIEVNRNNPMTHFHLAAALALTDRQEEAREATRAGLELNPSFTMARWEPAALSDNPVYLAGRKRICEGMRLAGVPEA